MNILDREKSLVLVIDFQGKLAEIVHESAAVLGATKRLLALAELFEVPVLLSEEYPQGLGVTEDSLQQAFDGLSTAKKKIEKASFGCCGDPGFEGAVAELCQGREPSERQFVIAGIEAHVCVVQTVLELLRQGSQVFVCWECVSGRGVTYRRWAIERMQQAGAAIVNHESVGFEWARTKDHPRFREMSRLFREGQIGGEQSF